MIESLSRTQANFESDTDLNSYLSSIREKYEGKTISIITYLKKSLLYLPLFAIGYFSINDKFTLKIIDFKYLFSLFHKKKHPEEEALNNTKEILKDYIKWVKKYKKYKKQLIIVALIFIFLYFAGIFNIHSFVSFLIGLPLALYLTYVSFNFILTKFRDKQCYIDLLDQIENYTKTPNNSAKVNNFVSSEKKGINISQYSKELRKDLIYLLGLLHDISILETVKRNKTKLSCFIQKYNIGKDYSPNEIYGSISKKEDLHHNKKREELLNKMEISLPPEKPIEKISEKDYSKAEEFRNSIYSSLEENQDVSLTKKLKEDYGYSAFKTIFEILYLTQKYGKNANYTYWYREEDIEIILDIINEIKTSIIND